MKDRSTIRFTAWGLSSISQSHHAGHLVFLKNYLDQMGESHDPRVVSVTLTATVYAAVTPGEISLVDNTDVAIAGVGLPTKRAERTIRPLEAPMVSVSPAPTTPLPRNWPLCVRSAVIHTISLAHASLTHARSVAANSINARIRLQAENDRLRNEILLLQEEVRIKDARWQTIAPHRRPHYPPVERLAILELRAARGWSQAQAADRILVSPATIASWLTRLDEEGPDALVQTATPVNKFPEFVEYIVRRLKVLCPSMGKGRIARVLCRAGLHLGATTVRRMLRAQDRPRPASPACTRTADSVVTARRPNHVWHVDLSTVPTSLGFWVSWLPFALPQVWPFCWWVAVVEDHFSRRLMGTAVYTKNPSSCAVRRLLEETIHAAGSAPDHLITDKGIQFIAKTFRRWCRRWHIQQRFGAVGKYGSVAIVERLIRSLKNECTRRILVPYRLTDFEQEVWLWSGWYNGDRPHEALAARTPDEVYFRQRPACRAPRFEPRPGWPRASPCAAPPALVRGRPGVHVDAHVGYRSGRRHLPVIQLRRAA